MNIPLSPTQWFRRWKYHRDHRRGYFDYFGETVYFPPQSLVHRCAVTEGFYEVDNLRILQKAHHSGTCMIDVGANIGLMSVPILQQDPNARVIALEASPSVTPYLAKTISRSPNQSRWKLIEAAAGAEPGTAQFYCSAQDGNVYDGLRNTKRAENGSTHEVRVTTLSDVWRQEEEPHVSLIKIDVEGAEADVLRGAAAVLKACSPAVLLEWNLQNLEAYNTPPSLLFDLASELNYTLHAVPSLARVPQPNTMRFYAGLNESFLLLPQ